MISTVTNQGRANGMIIDGAFNHEPSYSPELSPDVRLNADLKQAIGTKVPVRTQAKLRAAANDHMQLICADRDRVRGNFQDPSSSTRREDFIVPDKLVQLHHLIAIRRSLR